MTIAFIGSIYLCYKSTWILLIDVVLMGICLIMLFDMLLQHFFVKKFTFIHVKTSYLNIFS